jgi:SAM-dependent methyltransferase
LEEEVTGENPYLDGDEQNRLRKHYPKILQLHRYPSELSARIYAQRRSYPVQAILEAEDPVVLDAGCGFGSDSFLFASLGAKVLALDICPERVGIGLKRRRYYETLFGRPLDVTFGVADLNDYKPEWQNLSLTWLASILAVIGNQEDFLNRVYKVTRAGGKVMVMDFNLLNPHFLWGEWWRRRRAMPENPEFSREANFWSMVRRRGRKGARFFRVHGREDFDDVQFFSPGTLGRLLQDSGFGILKPAFTGFSPPFLLGRFSTYWEKRLSRVPGLRHLGWAYLITGVK